MDTLEIPWELSWAFYGKASLLHRLEWIAPDGQEAYLSKGSPLAVGAKAACGMRGTFRSADPEARANGLRCDGCRRSGYPTLPYGHGIPR